MSRFGYLRDPLFLSALAGYALNQWLFKALWPALFLQGQFNDLVLIPAALPAVLWAQRVIGLRDHDRPPLWSEMILHLVAWSAICEFIGPHWLHHGTADGWDVVAYAVGGIMACVWWNRSVRPVPRGAR